MLPKFFLMQISPRIWEFQKQPGLFLQSVFLRHGSSSQEIQTVITWAPKWMVTRPWMVVRRRRQRLFCFLQQSQKRRFWYYYVHFMMPRWRGSPMMWLIQERKRHGAAMSSSNCMGWREGIMTSKEMEVHRTFFLSQKYWTFFRKISALLKQLL